MSPSMSEVEALRRYPPSQLVEDYDGDRYVDDEWGYDESQRKAFVAGAKWQAEQCGQEIGGQHTDAKHWAVIGRLREQVAELTAANDELAMKVSDLQCELSHLLDVIERAKKAPPATTPWFRHDSVYTILDSIEGVSDA